MLIDFPGRVTNLQLSPKSCLDPLFEAISNALHAIESGNKSRRAIRILVDRDSATQLPLGDLAAISTFHIEDTGVGFTNENYSSFQRCDTTYKAHLGGKGVGRLFWLKAFRTVHVNSIYRENGSYYQREFDFTLSEDGIVNPQISLLEGAQQHQTVVSLIGIYENYQQHLPKKLQTIAERIVEHFYQLMFLSSFPAITISDGEDDVGVQNIFSELFVSCAHPTQLIPRMRSPQPAL